MILLIQPPVTKACEPPAGIARLGGALAAAGVRVGLLDLNLEGQLHLLDGVTDGDDTWTRRAVRQYPANRDAIRSPRTYRHPARYRTAVAGLDRLLLTAGRPFDVRVGLADFTHDQLSPLRSNDLLQAAEKPESNPFAVFMHHRLRQAIEQHRPSLIGISMNFLNQALCTFSLIGMTRRDFPGIPLVLGGGLLTSWMRRPDWQDPFAGLVDRCVDGPGEAALLDLAGVNPPENVPPHPDYDEVPWEHYLAPGRILPFSASRGCYWNRCAFCSERTEGGGWHPLPPDRATAMLQQLADRYHPALIHLLDNALSPALLRSLAECPPGAPWYGFARITPILEDESFCRRLAAAGCTMLQLGLESADPDVLAAMRKGIHPESAARALQALHRSDIRTYVYLLFGTPWETIRQARRTLDFVVRHADAIDCLNLSIFTLPRDCDEAAELETGEFFPGDLSLYQDFRHPGNWDRRAVRRFLADEFRVHPAIRPILHHRPPHFGSNHAPFFPLLTLTNSP